MSLARPGGLEPPTHSLEVVWFSNEINGVLHNSPDDWPLEADGAEGFANCHRVMRAAGRDRLVSGEINPFPETAMFTVFDLHVFAAQSNPLHYRASRQNWERYAGHMLDAGVTLTVIEYAYGDEDHVCGLDGVRHILVRAKTRLWTKENGGR